MTILSEKAMLVSLSISKWSAKKLDKKATREVLDKYNAGENSGRFNKELIARENLETIRKTSNEARAFHYENTLPWSNDGARILPAKNFDKYSAKMRDFRNQFEGAVSDFLQNYDNFVDAARIRLNGLFDSADYPDRWAIEKKINFDIEIDPIPSDNDFRVNLQCEEVFRIKKKLEARAERATAEAMRDLWDRLFKAVSAIQERMTDEKDGKRKIFRDSIVNNLCELTSILSRLNITDDPHLEKMRQEVEAKLCRAEPEDLREDAAARRRVATDATEILGAMSAYMGAA